MTGVEVRHLTKRFGAQAAVADLTFSAAPGVALAIAFPLRRDIT